jgi:hypothetical protein
MLFSARFKITVAREREQEENMETITDVDEKHFERKMQYCLAITAMGKGSMPGATGYACGSYLYYLRNCPTYCCGAVVSVLYYKKRKSWLV